MKAEDEHGGPGSRGQGPDAPRGEREPRGDGEAGEPEGGDQAVEGARRDPRRPRRAGRRQEPLGGAAESVVGRRRLGGPGCARLRHPGRQGSRLRRRRRQGVLGWPFGQEALEREVRRQGGHLGRRAGHGVTQALRQVRETRPAERFEAAPDRRLRVQEIPAAQEEALFAGLVLLPELRAAGERRDREVDEMAGEAVEPRAEVLPRATGVLVVRVAELDGRPAGEGGDVLVSMVAAVKPPAGPKR